ncbi:hypothetical protein [Arthrobacter sp. ISL-28]|uniref:hypothetical protein n=1 Tax=Arthrobacter sp. ISL-28 TaxID=2819108 RepID=UPI001BEAB365|nr:hypothetical protein [Arthrobacter sp. ISL-28]MBT2523081.1 hypothetical protein [Arthrobacter sp. ISL-28]
MSHIYFASTLLLVAAGIFCTVAATTTLRFGLGLALLTVGAGGFSAGIVARRL